MCDARCTMFTSPATVPMVSPAFAFTGDGHYRIRFTTCPAQHRDPATSTESDEHDVVGLEGVLRSRDERVEIAGAPAFEGSRTRCCEHVSSRVNHSQ